MLAARLTSRHAAFGRGVLRLPAKRQHANYPPQYSMQRRMASLSERVEGALRTVLQPKRLLGAGLLAGALFGLHRASLSLSTFEHQRGASLTHSSRTLIGFGTGHLLARLSNERIRDLLDRLAAKCKVQKEEDGGKASRLQLLLAHALLLRSLALNDQNRADPLAKEHLSVVQDALACGDLDLDVLAANIALTVLQSGSTSNEEMASTTMNVLESLRHVLESSVNEPSGEQHVALQNGMALAIGRLLAAAPQCTSDVVDRLSFGFLAGLSQAQAVSNEFFLPIVSMVAERSAADVVEVDDELLELLQRAVMFNRTRYSPSDREKMSEDLEEMNSVNSDISTSSAASELLLEQVGRCLANLALQDVPEPHEELRAGEGEEFPEDIVGQSRLVVRGALPLLKVITESSTSYNSQLQAARALTNISSWEGNVDAVVEEGWVPVLMHWLTQECQQSVTGQVREANASKVKVNIEKKQKVRGKKELGEPQYDARLVASCAMLSLANVASADPKAAALIAKRLPFSDLVKISAGGASPTFVLSLCRLLTAVGSHASDRDVAKELMSRVGLWGLNQLLSIDSVDTSPFVAKLIASICEDKNMANMILEDLLPSSVRSSDGDQPIIQHGWDLISKLAESTDVAVRRHVCRAVANIGSGVRSVDSLLRKPHIMEWLDEWVRSADEVLAANAVRAQATLFADKVTGEKYPQGIYLLYPPPSTSKLKADFDIVLIHGIDGNPLHTWEAADGSCWPQKWLPEVFPKTRVITVAHHVPMTRWTGHNVELEHLARELVDKLALANVGERPIVFITHSFGGILLKQMLKYMRERDTGMLESLKGCVFYGVPHRGADVAAFADTLLFQRSDAIELLHPKQSMLEELHQEFEELAPKAATLSFGENDKTCFARYTCFQLVSDHSANPQFTTDARHKFVKLAVNHYQTCKPADKSDSSYTEVVDFLKQCLSKEN